MRSVHHGQNGFSSARDVNPSMITSKVGLSPTCCSGIEMDVRSGIWACACSFASTLL